MDALTNLCGGTTGKYKQPSWENICKLIPKRYHTSGKVPEIAPDHFNEITESIRHIIDISSNALRTRTIVLLYQNQSVGKHTINEQDGMEVLFRRVNAGGTVLQGEEMAYSLLKSSWDGAYDIVSKIVRSDSIGYLLPSTGIVMAATRLTRFIQGKSDVPNPGIGNFRKWIGEKEEGSSFLETIQNLLSMGNANRSVFHEIVESFCELILYRESISDDIGLPKKLLLSIKPTLYHPVFIWIYTHENNKAILENSRINILKYLMYCFLTVEKYDKVSKIAIEVIRHNTKTSFPDKEIYDKLLDEELIVVIPTPKEFAKPFEVPADGFLRHGNDLFNIQDDPFNQFRQWFWNDSKELLLWVQRK